MVHKWRALIDSFTSNYSFIFFSIAAPFHAIAILTILLDKRQKKSFEDKNIIIKMKLFCLQNVFFWGEKAILWKKNVFEKKLKKKHTVIWN